MIYEPDKKLDAYQFMKYHSFSPNTHFNILPMFYGNSYYSKKGTNHIKFFKQNGFITGHVVKDTSDKYKQPWWVDSWTIFDDLPNPCNINETNLDISNDNIWHTLSGTRLIHKPTQRGIYLHGGKKVMVK